MSAYQAPVFLTDLLRAKSPSGAEAQAQAVYDHYVRPHAAAYANDALGNRLATLNPQGGPTLMLAGHMDELGLIITYVNKDGYLYFDTIGGHDRSIISGRRVILQTAQGLVKGVTGKRAIHLMDEADRKKVPEIHEIWIDIGAKTKAEALTRVAIGDVATYDHEFELINGSIGTARAFDNKVGAYIVGEALIRLAQGKGKLAAKVVSVATTQEEIGTRGAQTSAFAVDPHVASSWMSATRPTTRIATSASMGRPSSAAGPSSAGAPNINPKVFERLVACAKKAKIPYQVEADPRPTGTDARAIQMARGGRGLRPRVHSRFATCTRPARSWISRTWSTACSCSRLSPSRSARARASTGDTPAGVVAPAPEEIQGRGHDHRHHVPLVGKADDMERGIEREEREVGHGHHCRV
jgi:putative aminopeptidase FrvX